MGASATRRFVIANFITVFVFLLGPKTDSPPMKGSSVGCVGFFLMVICWSAVGNPGLAYG